MPETQESIGELIKRLRDEFTLLVQQEVALAKTEMGEKAARIGRNVGYIAAGAFLGLCGFVVLLIAMSSGLEVALAEAGWETTAHWLAPLIVGGLVAGVGYFMVQKGVDTLEKEPLVPEKTARSLEENKEWLKDKAV